MVPAPGGEVGQAGGEGATQYTVFILFIFLVGLGWINGVSHPISLP